MLSNEDVKTEAILSYFESNLISEGMKLYKTGGRRIFEVRDSTGKVTNLKMIILHAIRDDKHYSWSIEFHEAVPDIQTFLNHVANFKYHIKNHTAADFDPDGASVRRMKDNVKI